MACLAFVAVTYRMLEPIVFGDTFAVGLVAISLIVVLVLVLGTGCGGLDFCFDDEVVAGGR